MHVHIVVIQQIRVLVRSQLGLARLLPLAVEAVPFELQKLSTKQKLAILFGKTREVAAIVMVAYLILSAAHLPPPVLLPLPHVLQEQAPPALLRVVAPLEHGVRPRVARRKAELAVRAVSTATGGRAVDAAAE